jgi:hypothetical protein
MDQEIQKLRVALARLEPGRGRRYSAAHKTRIVAEATELRRRGRGWQAIGRLLGVPHETIRRFARESETPAFIPVEVATPSNAGLVLVAPDGYRLEGLTVADAADLLKRLR